ncbi:hypothetical protein GF312_01670 [Candidatus Poribacteria bacterium]|nr:hypothetical protein [Candidatus Poribacteria bacterium]
MKNKFNVALVICLLAMVIIVGCGEDLPIFVETLDIISLDASQSSMSTGGTATIQALVDYTGDETVLLYKWSATGGTIQGDDNRATYIAPDSPGVYSINLRVSDGVISDEKTIEINVSQQDVESIIMDRDTHWPSTSYEDELAYDVNVKSIETGKVFIHYEIVQDMDRNDAFLSIYVNQTVVLDNMAIGGEQPSTDVITIRNLDVSNVITRPGRYMITFVIIPGDRVENGWLMQEARLDGVIGTSDPQQ